MTRNRLNIAVLLATFALAFFLVWLSLFAASFRARSQAESLLQEVDSMKVGLTTLEEVRPRLAKFRLEKLLSPNECPNSDVGY